MKEIMVGRPSGIGKTMTPQEKLILSQGKVDVASIKDAASPNCFVGSSKGKTMCPETQFSVSPHAKWEGRKVGMIVRCIESDTIVEIGNM